MVIFLFWATRDATAVTPGPFVKNRFLDSLKVWRERVPTQAPIAIPIRPGWYAISGPNLACGSGELSRALSSQFAPANRRVGSPNRRFAEDTRFCPASTRALPDRHSGSGMWRLQGKSSFPTIPVFKKFSSPEHNGFVLQSIILT